MKYSLRSLMIVALVLPPLLAGGWHFWQRYQSSSVNLWSPDLMTNHSARVRRFDYRKLVP